MLQSTSGSCLLPAETGRRSRGSAGHYSKVQLKLRCFGKTKLTAGSGCAVIAWRQEGLGPGVPLPAAPGVQPKAICCCTALAPGWKWV